MSIKHPLRLAIAMAAFTLINPLQAAQLSADSRISNVLVYPGSAMITRVARLSLPAGSHTVELKGLPLSLLASSLRVEGNASVDVLLGSIELKETISKEAVQTKEKALRAKIEALNDEKKGLTDRISANNDQLNYIRNMAKGDVTSEKSSYLQLPIEQWNTAWDTLGKATTTAHEHIRDAQKQQRSLDREVVVLQKMLNQIATNQRGTRVAVLDINSKADTELELKLRYHVNGARWQPVYDANLDTKTEKIELKSLAQITQRTGEDWNNVDITLSTLRPSASSQLPQINPWLIDFLPDREDSAMMSRSMNSLKKVAPAPQMEEISADMVMPNVAASKKRMRNQISTIAIADFSAEYKVPTKVTLNSGSDKRRVTLQSQYLDAKVKLASVPRLDPRAMLLTKAEYKGDIPLLAGAVVLRRDGSYIGNTHLRKHQSGETLNLSFGEDDKVKIKFIPEPDKKGEDGLLFSKRKTIKRHYHFSVTSQHNKPYEISFSDMIPVAMNEDINVTIMGDKPTQTEVDKRKGITTWDRTLASGKTLKLEYGYEVTYPDDKRVNGL